MREDRQFRVRIAREEIEALVSKYQVREAWSKTQWWYLEAKGHRVPPTSEQLDQTSILQEDLYRQRPPKGEPLPILVKLVSIADGPSEVGEIVAVVSKLWPGRREDHQV